MKKSYLKNILLIIVVLASMVLCGCVSPPKLPNGPVYFVDANNGKKIERVLIIPEYGTFSGISTKGGHDPTTSKGKSGILLANPFIYYSDGSPFKVKQPLSTEIVIPRLMMGIVHKGIGLERVDVYAKGYKVGDVPFHLLNKPRPATFRLKPLDKMESRKEFARISEGLRNTNFEVLVTYPPIREDEILEFDLSKKELKMVQDFFAADEKSE